MFYKYEHLKLNFQWQFEVIAGIYDNRGCDRTR